MARVLVSGDQIILTLSPREKFFGFHQSPKAKISEIVEIERVPNFWSTGRLGGIRAPGTGIPMVIGLGTWRKKGSKNFCAVYKKEPGFKITMKSGEFESWLFSSPELPSDLEKFVKSV